MLGNMYVAGIYRPPNTPSLISLNLKQTPWIIRIACRTVFADDFKFEVLSSPNAMPKYLHGLV